MFGPSGQNVQQHAAKEQEQKQDLVIALEVNYRDPQTQKNTLYSQKYRQLSKVFKNRTKNLQSISKNAVINYISI